MYWIGVDHHKMTDYVTSVKGDGSVYVKRRINAQPEALQGFFKEHPRPYVVGIEAAYAWEYVADIVEALGCEIQVAHPLLLKAFAKKHKKNDKIDSALIAKLLRRGDLPTITHPTKAARERRDLYRQRMDRVRRRSSLASRTKAWADRHGFQATMNLSTLKGVKLLAGLPVSPCSRVVQASHAEVLGFLYREIRRVEAEIDRVAEATEDVRIVDSVPGIGAYLALLISREIFDIERFSTSRRLDRSRAPVGSTEGICARTRTGTCAGPLARRSIISGRSAPGRRPSTIDSNGPKAGRPPGSPSPGTLPPSRSICSASAGRTNRSPRGRGTCTRT